MAWIGDLLGSVIQIAGVPLNQRATINYVDGVSGVDNPANDSTDLTFTGPASQEFLAASAVIDCSIGTKQNIYTVPASKTFVVTKIVLHSPTAALTTAQINLGYDSGCTNVGLSGLQSMPDSGFFTVGLPAGSTDSTPGHAGDILGAVAGTTQTSYSLTVDIFGYFI